MGLGRFAVVGSVPMQLSMTLSTELTIAVQRRARPKTRPGTTLGGTQVWHPLSMLVAWLEGGLKAVGSQGSTTPQNLHSRETLEVRCYQRRLVVRFGRPASSHRLLGSSVPTMVEATSIGFARSRRN